MSPDIIDIWVDDHTTNGGWIREGEFSLSPSSEESMYSPCSIPILNWKRFDLLHA